ncbi:MAG: HD domain-containing phosphohydrolase [Colwellia sp.]
MDKSTVFNIIVCDDSVTNVLVLSKIVKDSCRANTIEITDPRKLANVIKSTEVDLILLDIEMPHLSGFEILKAVRKTHSADALPIIIITGLKTTECRNEALSLGANDYVTKPFDQVEIGLRIKNHIKMRQAYKAMHSTQQKLEGSIDQTQLELRSSVKALVKSLAVAGELKDDDTGKHVCRVGRYAGILARGYGLPESIAQMIEQTAPLHDIGKIGVPDNILLKKGKLNTEERMIMEQHTFFGEKIISGHNNMLLKVAKSVALNHHERWDGSGYPHGLSGETIPIEGRITALADVFDALTTKRPYKEAWPLDKTIKKINDESGKHFDPSLVDIFNEQMDQFLEVMKCLPDDECPIKEDTSKLTSN